MYVGAASLCPIVSGSSVFRIQVLPINTQHILRTPKKPSSFNYSTTEQAFFVVGGGLAVESNSFRCEDARLSFTSKGVVFRAEVGLFSNSSRQTLETGAELMLLPYCYCACRRFGPRYNALLESLPVSHLRFLRFTP